MPSELIILAWGCVLGLVHVMVTIRAKTAQYGTRWNMSARDEALPEPRPLIGRLERAQANYFETFPLAAIAILIDAQAGLLSGWTLLGAALWIGARIVYLPLYAFGVPVVRSLVWAVGMLGIGLLLWPALTAAF